jgi:hypothetical protein
MQIDRQELYDHYAELSDEELLAIDKSDLTGVARTFYDAEIAKRHLTPDVAERPLEHHSVTRLRPEGDEETGAVLESDSGDQPEWLESAACAIAFEAFPGATAAADADNARDILVTAGIPGHIAVSRSDPDDPQSRYLYSVMVPGARNLEATSVLDREIYNPKEEAMWRTHFAALSNEELRALSWEAICAGLQDRIDRLKRAYNDEIRSRRSG